jgi:hypothetical protein
VHSEGASPVNTRKSALVWLFSALTLASMRAQPAPKQAQSKPKWISILPEAASRIYALGLATYSENQAQGIQQAEANARTEVITRLRASVKSETNVQNAMVLTQQAGGAATGTSTKSISQDVSISAHAADLPGLVVEEVWVDAAERTSYALAYLDLPVAERELRARFQASKQALAAEGAVPVAPREMLRTLKRLRDLQSAVESQDDLAALIAAGGGDAMLRASIRDQKMDLERRIATLCESITFNATAEKGLADIQAAVRGAILKEGLGWSDTQSNFTIRIRYSGQRQNLAVSKQQWWEYEPSPDFTIARGVVDLTLLDAGGHEYESTTIAAKGVGIDEATAQRALAKDYQAKLETAIRGWLESLGH